MPERICQSCGSKLAEDARFCPTCGRKVTDLVCRACGNPIPEGSNFCPNCGKGISANICEQCGTAVPEGNRLCPSCEEKEAVWKAKEAALLARKESEERAKKEKEAARKAREADLLSKREAEARAKEKARQEARAIAREKEVARKAKEGALLAKKETEKSARQEKTTAQSGPAPRFSRQWNRWFIAAGIFSIFVLVGAIYVFAFRNSTPNQEKTIVVDSTTPSINTTVTAGDLTPSATMQITATTTSPAPPETTSSETTTAVTTSQPTPSLAEVLARTAAIASVKYDTQITQPGTPTATMRTWEKNTRMRIETTEQGQDLVILIDNDAQTVYRYVPAQNSAERMPYPPPARAATQDAESIARFNPSVTGTDTMDGKKCLVVTYLVNNTPIRMWLWQDYGFPLRVEETTSGGMTVVEYSNIIFADIQDSLFQLPAGVQIIGPSRPPG